MRAAAVLVLCLAAWPAATAWGQLPAPLDSGAPEAARQTAHRDAALDAYDLPVGRFGPENRPVRPLEGRVVWSAYRLDDPDATSAGVIAGYRERLAAIGFGPVFACRDRACGGFDFRFGVELLPAPDMLIDTADFAQLSMEAPDQRYASVLASRVLGAVYVQTVMVQAEPPAPVPLAPAPAPAPESVEPPPATVVQPQAAPALVDALRRDGHVRLDGLVFEPGGARLSEASEQALDLAARMLEQNGEIALAIVGHSDNVGGLDPNMALSRRRAEAVRDALIARGVAPARLDARGVAWLAPVASNRTEEGRRRNRRVELVLK